MFRVPVRRQQILLVVGDLVILLVSLLLAFVIARFARFDILFVLDKFTGGSLIYFSVYLIVFYVGQLYEPEGSFRESRSFSYICLLVIVAFVIIATIYYAIPFWRIARRVIAIQAPLVALSIYFWRSIHDMVARRFVSPRKVLLVGAGETAEALIRDIKKDYSREYEITGIVDDDPARAGAEVGGVPVLGTSLEIGEITKTGGVEIIVFAS